MHAPTDELLVEQCRRGSAEAFSQLVQRQQGAVYSLCYRLTGDPMEAEDLAQEAFLRLYRSLGRFRRGARLRPWLHKITVNVCLDALRKRRGAVLSLDEVSVGSAQPKSPHRDEMPEVALLNGELQHRVQQALLQLPGEYRAALVLRYLEELSYREIAQAIGVPVSTIETRIYRAKRMLGEVLTADAGGKAGREHELQME